MWTYLECEHIMNVCNMPVNFCKLKLLKSILQIFYILEPSSVATLLEHDP